MLQIFTRTIPERLVKVCLAFSLGLMIITGITACGNEVTRVSPNKVTDLSGNWNDTDSRLVAAEMIKDVLSRNWLANFKRAHHKPPTVIVGSIRNLSYEHINTRTFVADMERELINSGEVDFVASSTERKEVRNERKDQDLNASEATRKPMGQETGADFMLKGTINSIVDVSGNEQARFYQIDLTLINLTTNQKVWIGQKKIKKIIEKSRFRL